MAQTSMSIKAQMIKTQTQKESRPIEGMSDTPSSIISTSSPKKQLDALTSLRFFACAAIIFLHSAWFFVDIDFMKNWQLDEGVAFFFVLSGFILTYVYPNLRGAENIKEFLVNRLGRMVPTHILLTFATLCVLPCSCATFGIFIANLFLIQSWIPRRDYYFGLNAPSWSICVEIFFSFAFVYLIRPWRCEQFDQKDMYPLTLKKGQLWTQTIYMPSSSEQRASWNKLGLRLSIHVKDPKHLHQYRILAPATDSISNNPGSIDWWSTRLTIPLTAKVL